MHSYTVKTQNKVGQIPVTLKIGKKQVLICLDIFNQDHIFL